MHLLIIKYNLKLLAVMKCKFITSLIFIAFSITANAQSKDSIQQHQLVFELPIFDMPYQLDAAKTVNGGNATFGSFFKGYANPSMHQSLSLSTDLYTGLHFGIEQLFYIKNNTRIKDRSFVGRMAYYISLFGTDVFTISAPA